MLKGKMIGKLSSWVIIGGLMLTVPTNILAAEGSNNVMKIEDIKKVYEENIGEGLLGSKAVDIAKDTSKDTDIEDILKVYEQNKGNGLLKAEVPDIDKETNKDTDTEKVKKLDNDKEQNKSLIDEVKNFFSNIFNWIKNIFA